jgi:hypothetical protein
MQVMIASLSRAILDCLVLPERLGVVHSAFDRATNILLDHSSRIIALTFASSGGLPYAFMLAESSPVSFISRGVTAGQKVSIEAGACLVIEGTQDRYDFSSATIWEPAMGKLTDPADQQAFRELLGWAAGYVYARANLAGLAPLLKDPRQVLRGTLELENTPDLRLAKLALPDVTGLLIALEQEDATMLSAAAARLIGYGIGGTPSGDDLLVGLLAALTRSNTSQAEQMRLLLTTCVDGQLHADATSLLSLTVLRHALAGEFSEKIHDVTRLLMHPDNLDSLEVGLQRLLLHGATSGSEMLLGVCLGFLLLQNDGSNTGKRL